MKYIIDLNTNSAFIQLFGLTETNTTMEAPLAFQVRGGKYLLEKIQRVLSQGQARIKDIDDRFHEDMAARAAFENGFVVFEPGEIPVTCIVCRRRATLVVGDRQVGTGSVQLDSLLLAVSTALASEL